jgi:GLPGLI family protein
MKKLFFLLVFSSILFTMGLRAQTTRENVKVIKVSYVATALSPDMLSIIKSQVGSPGQVQEYIDKIQKYKYFYSMYINMDTHESIYKLDSIHAEPAVMTAGNIDFVYTDSKGYMLGEEDFMKSRHFFKGSLSDLQWIIVDESKEISGYLCKKAIVKNHSDISVWFAPDIAINRGPGYFQGLIGLILEGNDFFGTTVVSSIEYLKDTNSFSQLKEKYKDEPSSNIISIKEVLSLKNNMIHTMKVTK